MDKGCHAPDSVQSPGHAIPVVNILLFQIKVRMASDIVIFEFSISTTFTVCGLGWWVDGLRIGE